MNKGLYEILENRQLNRGIYKMKLAGDTSAISRPGQFINISIEGCYLRRPVSICDYSEGIIEIVYKVVGRGTEIMATMTEGQQLDVLTGLGNGFDVSVSGEKPLLIGGGMGAAPMYGLAVELKKKGITADVILGFSCSDEVCLLDDFRKLGIEPALTTNDGSSGTRGFVTDVMKEGASYVYTCGPEPMLQAVWNKADCDGEFSFEKRMGCGFGACMGCSCETKYGNKRICVEGPVLKKEEIIW